MERPDVGHGGGSSAFEQLGANAPDARARSGWGARSQYGQLAPALSPQRVRVAPPVPTRSHASRRFGPSPTGLSPPGHHHTTDPSLDTLPNQTVLPARTLSSSLPSLPPHLPPPSIAWRSRATMSAADAQVQQRKPRQGTPPMSAPISPPLSPLQKAADLAGASRPFPSLSLSPPARPSSVSCDRRLC